MQTRKEAWGKHSRPQGQEGGTPRSHSQLCRERSRWTAQTPEKHLVSHQLTGEGDREGLGETKRRLGKCKEAEPGG